MVSDAADEAVGGTQLQIDVKLIGPEGETAAPAQEQGDTFVSDWPGQTLHHVEDDVFTVGLIF